MKLLFYIFLLLFYSSPSASVKKEVKEDLQLKQEALTKYSAAKIENMYSSLKQKMNFQMEELSYKQAVPVIPQSESKINSGIFYIVGAAALAVLVYFLWPDDPPDTTPGNTFGLPVTPK